MYCWFSEWKKRKWWSWLAIRMWRWLIFFYERLDVKGVQKGFKMGWDECMNIKCECTDYCIIYGDDYNDQLARNKKVLTSHWRNLSTYNRHCDNHHQNNKKLFRLGQVAKKLNYSVRKKILSKLLWRNKCPDKSSMYLYIMYLCSI